MPTERNCSRRQGGWSYGGAPRLSVISRNEENRTVKRTLMVAAGVTALCGGIFLAAGLSAQQPQPAPGGAPPVAGAPAAPAQPSARPTTRIALLNLSHVVKNYKKFQSFQEEMKKDLQSYEQKDKMLTAQLEGIAKEINGDPATGKPPAANKDQLEQQAKNLQRQMEDNRNEAKKVLSKKSDDQAVILYKEVMDATQRTAVAHGIELVLHYNDSVKSEEYWSAANVMRKM